MGQQMGLDSCDRWWNNLKQTYEHIRMRKEPADWHTAVWFPNWIPKHSFITWLAIRGGLKTLDKLFEWGIFSSNKCVFCYKEVEIVHHLFIGCQRVISAWMALMHRAGYRKHCGNIFMAEVNWVQRESNGRGFKQGALRHLFSSFIYHIWYMRNSIF